MYFCIGLRNQKHKKMGMQIKRKKYTHRGRQRNGGVREMNV